jgi:hypothetical protein
MALTMLIFGSEFCAENQCKIGEGGGYAISNFLFWCVMANTVKSMGEALPNSRGQNQDDDYDYDHGEEVDPDDETGQDMYFETAEAKYAKRPKPAPVYYDDENNNVSDDDDDDDDDEEDDDEEEVAPYNDDEENYRAQPAARDENYSIDDDDDDGGHDEHGRSRSQMTTPRSPHTPHTPHTPFTPLSGGSTTGAHRRPSTSNSTGSARRGSETKLGARARARVTGSGASVRASLPHGGRGRVGRLSKAEEQAEREVGAYLEQSLERLKKKIKGSVYRDSRL